MIETSEHFEDVLNEMLPSKATVRPVTFLPLVNTVNLLGMPAIPLMSPPPCALTLIVAVD